MAHGFEHEDEILGDDVARGARREGAAAEAGEGRVEGGDADIEAGDDVGEAEAARVVEVEAGEILGADGGVDGADECFDLGGVGVAGGVREADFMGAGGHEGFGEFDDLGLGDGAFEGAAEGGADAGFEMDLVGCCFAEGGDLVRLGEDLGVGAAEVLEAVGFRGGQRQGELVCAGGDGGGSALGVGDEDGDGEAGVCAGMGDDLCGVRELGEQGGGDEAADFDFPHAGIDKGVDPGGFDRGGENGADGLESVPRADFTDEDGLGHGLLLKLSGHMPEAHGFGKEWG